MRQEIEGAQEGSQHLLEPVYSKRTDRHDTVDESLRGQRFRQECDVYSIRIDDCETVYLQFVEIFKEGG